MYQRSTRIRVKLDLARMTTNDKLTQAWRVHDGLKDNPAYSDPPVDPEDLMNQANTLVLARVAAEDGGKQAIAEKRHAEKTLGNMLRDLARYVESKCKEDMQTFLSSGFFPVSNTRVTTPPRSETIRKVSHGEISGEAVIRLVNDPEAFSYELRWAEWDGHNEPAAEAWTFRPVTTTRPATVISGLTRGQTYVFEVRGVRDFGYTNWAGRVSWTSL